MESQLYLSHLPSSDEILSSSRQIQTKVHRLNELRPRALPSSGGQVDLTILASDICLVSCVDYNDFWVDTV